MKKLIIAISAFALVSLAATAQASGENTYKTACFACHGTGAAGAPKLGDKAAWKDRIAQGNEKLYEHSLKGFKGAKGVMPPKGGRPNLTDDQIKAVVAYMVNESK